MKTAFIALAAVIGLSFAAPSIVLAHGDHDHAKPGQVKKTPKCPRRGC
jgi:hypothetical protein